MALPELEHKHLIVAGLYRVLLLPAVYRALVISHLLTITFWTVYISWVMLLPIQAQAYLQAYQAQCIIALIKLVSPIHILVAPQLQLPVVVTHPRLRQHHQLHPLFPLHQPLHQL